MINTVEFYCVIFKNLKIDGALFGVVGNVPPATDKKYQHEKCLTTTDTSINLTCRATREVGKIDA